MATVFRFKAVCTVKADPQVVGEQCVRLQNQPGGLTPARLVDANRDPDAPLHNEFEWDDAIAAEKFRVEQAKYIIRHLVVEHVDEDGEVATPSEPVRAFVNIIDGETKERTYWSLPRVLSNDESRAQMFAQARRDMVAFQTKYSVLQELKPVFDAMDAVLVSGIDVDDAESAATMSEQYDG